MKKKLLIGIIVVFGIAVAIFMNMLVAGALIVVWIYLVWMVREKKANLFHDQVEPKIAERRLKMLKAFLLVAGISLAAFIVNLVLQIAIGDPSEEGPVVFYIALFLLCCFI